MTPTLFRWEHYADRLLQRIAGAAGLPVAEAASALGERYGVVPGEEFISEAWPVLLDTWLEADRASAALIAAQLRAQGLGDRAQTGTSAAALMQYLRGCESSAPLHRVVLAAFLSAGAAPTSAGAAGPRRRRSRRKAAGGFRLHVEGVVREVLGVDHLVVEPDGSIRLPGGAAASFLQTVDDPPQVRIVSRFTEEQVSVALDLPGPHVAAEDLASALQAHRRLTAVVDRDLRGRDGGRTAAPEIAEDPARV